VTIQIPISQAKAKLTELVRLSEGGEEVVLTRHGRAVIRFEPVCAASTREKRRAALEELSGILKGEYDGPSERVTDFLYDENGLPG
jgi:antitoxin (DNA-binding transcriptional repressor) of toxin-antitoxin stability system